MVERLAGGGVERLDRRARPGVNFHAAEWCTYFVGSDTWGFSLWVHNTHTGGGAEGQGGPSSVHRVFEEGKPKFQLRKGEEGLSVFDADVVSPEDILPNFRPGSRITTQQRQLIESQGLRIRQTPGNEGLPSLLRDNHYEIQPGDGMTRNQFKEPLKKLEKLVNGE